MPTDSFVVLGMVPPFSIAAVETIGIQYIRTKKGCENDAKCGFLSCTVF